MKKMKAGSLIEIKLAKFDCVSFITKKKQVCNKGQYIKFEFNEKEKIL